MAHCRIQNLEEHYTMIPKTLTGYWKRKKEICEALGIDSINVRNPFSNQGDDHYSPIVSGAIVDNLKRGPP